jgi:hypothetical protein
MKPGAGPLFGFRRKDTPQTMERAGENIRQEVSDGKALQLPSARSRLLNAVTEKVGATQEVSKRSRISPGFAGLSRDTKMINSMFDFEPVTGLLEKPEGLDRSVFHNDESSQYEDQANASVILHINCKPVNGNTNFTTAHCLGKGTYLLQRRTASKKSWRAGDSTRDLEVCNVSMVNLLQMRGGGGRDDSSGDLKDEDIVMSSVPDDDSDDDAPSMSLSSSSSSSSDKGDRKRSREEKKDEKEKEEKHEKKSSSRKQVIPEDAGAPFQSWVRFGVVVAMDNVFIQRNRGMPLLTACARGAAYDTVNYWVACIPQPTDGGSAFWGWARRPRDRDAFRRYQDILNQMLTWYFMPIRDATVIKNFRAASKALIEEDAKLENPSQYVWLLCPSTSPDKSEPPEFIYRGHNWSMSGYVWRAGAFQSGCASLPARSVFSDLMEEVLYPTAGHLADMPKALHRVPRCTLAVVVGR